MKPIGALPGVHVSRAAALTAIVAACRFRSFVDPDKPSKHTDRPALQPLLVLATLYTCSWLLVPAMAQAGQGVAADGQSPRSVTAHTFTIRLKDQRTAFHQGEAVTLE